MFSCFSWILHTFLPVRKNWMVRVLAVFFCSFLTVVIVYSNDLANLLGTLIGFCIYLIIFHRGRWVEKLTAVLIFYPAVIAVNYMMQDIGSNIFFGLTGDNIGDNISEWPPWRFATQHRHPTPPHFWRDFCSGPAPGCFCGNT